MVADNMERFLCVKHSSKPFVCTNLGEHWHDTKAVALVLIPILQRKKLGLGDIKAMHVFSRLLRVCPGAVQLRNGLFTAQQSAS